MKPRPLYRSVTFWSGILMMGFICWAWWDSTHFNSLAIATPYSAANRSGMVLLRKVTYPPTVEAGRYRMGGLSMPSALGVFHRPLFARSGNGEFVDHTIDRPLFEAMASKVRAEPKGAWLFAIPHWLLLLAVALPWSGLLLWRARRHHRAGEFIPPS